MTDIILSLLAVSRSLRVQRARNSKREAVTLQARRERETASKVSVLFAERDASAKQQAAEDFAFAMCIERSKER
jgi:hypothetical protein